MPTLKYYDSATGTWKKVGYSSLTNSIVTNVNNVSPDSGGNVVIKGSDITVSSSNTNTIDTELGNKANSTHSHAAGDITSGTLSVSRGGTGVTSITSGNALIGSGTGAITSRAITNLTAKGAVTGSTNLATANTVLYHVQQMLNRTATVNAADTAYTTYKARGEALFTADTNPTVNGTISWTYK